MRLHYLPVILVCFYLFFSCITTDEEKAAARLNHARLVLGQNDTLRALRELDTTLMLFPKATYSVSSALRMKQEILWSIIRKKETELDSVNAKIKRLMLNFIPEKAEFERNLKYVHKNFRDTNRGYKSYLKTETGETGSLVLSGYYYGGGGHTKIKVTAGDKSAETAEILPGNIDNYQGNSFGMRWERLTLRNGKENGVLDFLAAPHQRIEVQFSGKGSNSFLLGVSDQVACRETVELAGLIKKRDILTREIADLSRVK